jgi:probable F420-dependent oxidoreductase
MALRFGIHVPTCIEGMMYPIPFATAADILPTALLAERLGYDSVWGNDHMTTQRYVQREFDAPPNYYEPLVTFTWIAARTTRLRVGTCILVLPMRHMVVAAKQAATLDQLSGGRLILGVGTGAYREEYEALFPDARGAHRGTIVDEGMRALRQLFTERRATFRGRHVRFEDVECFPKPVQSPLPIYAGGNHPEVRRRAGELGEGWLPAVLSPDEIRRGVADVRRAAERAGRDPSRIDIAPQFAVSIGRTHEDAVRRFRASQLFKHLESLKATTLREQTGGFEDRNLIGSPDAIAERIRVYERAGVTTLAGMLFVAGTVAEMHEAIELFGREVLPHFAAGPPGP